ncbi:MAG: alpha/beta fold hydrolase, partial [Anaerolineae bacterium]
SFAGREGMCLMRRLFGCFFTLLLIGAVFLVLVARGPGLDSMPVSISFEPLMDIVGLNVAGGRAPASLPPTPAQATPVAQRPTTIPSPPSETANPPTATPERGDVTLTVDVTSPAGAPLDAIMDGNAITLTAQVLNSTQAAIAGIVSFSLIPSYAGDTPVADCQIDVEPGQKASCTTRTAADGWAWEDHIPVGRRTIYAMLAGHGLTASVEVPVQPKPVVLVHGFTSSAATWSVWTGPGGFLATWGIAGYAVGDDQFDIEPMNTGDFTQPRRPAKSIAENAEIVARYVEAVRQATGAERVDLVAHSMGGLISRYYISHLMPQVERQGLPTAPAVNQLYMIGTPNAGTSCAIPPATLGLYSPATTQLTPSYVQHLFNRESGDPRGVPFFVLAGDPVHDFAALVCTPVPTDVFVSVGSAAGAIPVQAEIMPVRHGEQTNSPEVFATVLQSLSRSPDEYPIPLPAAPAVAPTDTAGLQVSLVDSGTLSAGRPTAVSVTVDEAEAASFILYAPGQDVEMSILTNTGQSITLETAKSAPDVSTAEGEGRGTTATQGFKIEKPKAGQWQLVVAPRAGAKTEGAFYAVAAFLQSDLRMGTETDSPVVAAGKSVPIRATLSGPVAQQTVTAIAKVRDARGNEVSETPMSDDGAHGDGKAGDGVYGSSWTPMEAGLYTIVVMATGQNMAGTAFQRVGVLAVEAQ